MLKEKLRCLSDILILLMMGVVSLPAQQLSALDSSRIMTSFYQQQDAWNEGDVEQFMQAYWPDDRLVFIGSNGPTYGYENVKQNYYRRYPDKTAMGTLKFEVIELSQIDEKTVFQIGKFHLTRTIGNLEGYFSLIWKKFGNKWLIISDHTTAAQ